MPPFVLAHLSDPHLAPMPKPRLRELAGKRAIGHLNWTRNRHRVHQKPVLDALVHDLKAHHPDHVAVTGDIVNLSLEAEFAPARAWLESVGPPADVSVVPGNHDAYARRTRNQFATVLRDYLTGDDDHAGAASFPFVRRRGPVLLIGTSTAVPTAPFMATGKLGPAQLGRLERILAQSDGGDAFRVLLIHHPMKSLRDAWHKQLTDADALMRLLRRHAVDLVLHGHDHRHALVWIDGPKHRIPVLGVPSASGALRERGHAAGYNLYTISRDGAQWRCDASIRGLTKSGFTELRRERLDPPPC